MAGQPPLTHLTLRNEPLSNVPKLKTSLIYDLIRFMAPVSNALLICMPGKLPGGRYEIAESYIRKDGKIPAKDCSAVHISFRSTLSTQQWLTKCSYWYMKLKCDSYLWNLNTICLVHYFSKGPVVCGYSLAPSNRCSLSTKKACYKAVIGCGVPVGAHQKCISNSYKEVFSM